ncbi:hypothetical protein V8G54_006953 [Vigna mungo]|uniref:CCHC-type domain-containing protein n=1 Tax=Vigna mungo TaxID=3915 RepID=A0AAQ3P004_VIGMU
MPPDAFLCDSVFYLIPSSLLGQLCRKMNDLMLGIYYLWEAREYYEEWCPGARYQFFGAECSDGLHVENFMFYTVGICGFYILKGRMILDVGCDVDRKEAVAGGVGCGGGGFSDQLWLRTAAAGAGAEAGAQWTERSDLIDFPTVMHLTGEIHVGVSGEEDWSMLLVEEALNLYYAICKTLIISHLFSVLVDLKHEHAFLTVEEDWIMLLVEETLNLYYSAFDCQEEGNCKRPGHYARECPNVAICHNCGLPGHIASECTTKSLCWNCKEPGHMASNCPNEGICHTCGKAGHRARECTAPPMPPGDLRLCNNCYKQGHIAAECTNEKACNNCRKTGHLARDCPNDPICNLCNVSGHVARQCPKANVIGDRSGGGGGGGGGGGARGGGGYRDVICRNCQQLGHMSRDCMGPLMICHNCGGRGHLAYECPSGRFMDRYPRRY